MDGMLLRRVVTWVHTRGALKAGSREVYSTSGQGCRTPEKKDLSVWLGVEVKYKIESGYFLWNMSQKGRQKCWLE